MRRRGRQLLEVVGRDHHRELRLVGGEPIERGEQHLAARQVEARTRLVEQEQPRPGDERPRDQGPLALALGAIAEPALADRAEPERPEQAVGPVEVELGEPLLEVPDRRCRAGRITSRTVSSGAKRWPTRASTKPIDSRRRATSVRPIVSPRISTVPRLANSTAPARVSRVVLPAPFGPSTAQRSPG